MGKLFNRPQVKYETDRDLKEADVNSNPGDPPRITANDIFNAFEDVLRKTRELENDIISASEDLTVPVEDGATGVRASVRRRDPNVPDGSYISFDTYHKALQQVENGRRFSQEEAAGLSLVSAIARKEQLASTLSAKRNNISKLDAEYAASQAGYMVILQRLQRGFQALETQGQTSSKLPPSSETATVLKSLVQSIAFQILYTNNTVDQIKRALKDAKYADSVQDIDSLITQAQSIAATTIDNPNNDIFVKNKSHSDSLNIIRYAHDYISTTDKVGYEPWAMLPDTKEIKLDLLNDITLKSKFELGSPMHPDLEKIYNAKVRDTSEAIDYIASSLANNEPDVAALCSLNWLFNIPLSILLLMESLYLAFLAIRSIQYKDAYDIQITPKNIFANLIIDVLQMIVESTKRLLCWFQRDPEIWALIYECPPVAELVDGIITMIEEAERWAFSQIQESIDELRARYAGVKAKATITFEVRRIREFLERIRYVIRAAKNVETSLKQVKDIPEAYAVQYKKYKNRIKVKLNNKAKNFRQFEKKRFSSDFVKNEFQAGRIPTFVPFVANDCGLSDPPSVAKQKKVADILMGKGFLEEQKQRLAQLQKLAGNLLTDIDTTATTLRNEGQEPTPLSDPDSPLLDEVIDSPF